MARVAQTHARADIAAAAFAGEVVNSAQDRKYVRYKRDRLMFDPIYYDEAARSNSTTRPNSSIAFTPEGSSTTTRCVTPTLAKPRSWFAISSGVPEMTFSAGLSSAG